MDIKQQLKLGYTEKDAPRAPTTLMLRAARHIEELEKIMQGMTNHINNAEVTIKQLYQSIDNLNNINIKLNKELENERAEKSVSVRESGSETREVAAGNG